jgi:hypothetical protein
MISDLDVQSFLRRLEAARVAHLDRAARLFGQSEVDPVIYADDIDLRPGTPPVVAFFPWDGGRHVIAVLLGARAPDLILCEYGWLRAPTPDPDLIRTAEELGAALRRVVLP